MEQNTTNDKLTILLHDTIESKTQQKKWAKLEAFLEACNRPAPDSGIRATPDGKAKTLVISYVENQLDTLFLGQWSTRDFQYKVIGNEIVGCITLEVVHPLTGTVRTLIGTAAQAIMMDQVPEDVKGRERNLWAQDIANKKSKALKMNIPALKSECLKNAALSLGKAFGKDINRKAEEQATYSGGRVRTTRVSAAEMEKFKGAVRLGRYSADDIVEELADRGIILPEDQHIELSTAQPAQLNGHA